MPRPTTGGLVGFDSATELRRTTGVDLLTIDGINAITARDALSMAEYISENEVAGRLRAKFTCGV